VVNLLEQAVEQIQAVVAVVQQTSPTAWMFVSAENSIYPE
jgi:hypothetical protein